MMATATTQQATPADQLTATTTTTKFTQEAHILADIATAQQEQYHILQQPQSAEHQQEIAIMQNIVLARV